MTKIIVANWKENPDKLEIARKLIEISEKFEKKASDDLWFRIENKTERKIKYDIKIAHAVPSIFAEKLFLESRMTKIILQNISQFEEGGHTGEISAKQMLDCGIKASIVGHSETRLSPQNPKGDEDKDVNIKILNLFKNDCAVLLCVGEYERDKQESEKKYLFFIQNQLEKCLVGVEKKDLENILIAYEPVWAIGKNAKRTATPAEIIEVINSIKKYFIEKFGYNHMEVLYGGSVTENNAKEILDLDCVDGLLVGRASSDPQTWEKLLENINLMEPENSPKPLKYNNISDLDIKMGDLVLLRLDLNLPISDHEEIVNDFRIQESLKTIKYLQEKSAKIIILAHKDKGNFNIIAKHLQNKIKLSNFKFIPFVTGKEVEKAVEGLSSGEILLLDNLRLDEREKKNDKVFAKYFVNLNQTKNTQTFYINEAFSASHRIHASIVGIPEMIDKKNCALGLKFAEEIEKLSLALKPKHPLFLVVGGAKFDTKLAMLNKFMNLAENIFVGGALAHNFWKQKYNYNLGKSLLDEGVVLAENILQEVNKKIILPSDVMMESREIKLPDQIQVTERIVDFGEKTFSQIVSVSEKANTIVWNGPLGYYEGGFEWGTKNLLLALSDLHKKNKEKAIILGGGDTVTEIDKLNSELVAKGSEKLNFTHVSTGGGAMIEFLSNGTLPGIEAVTK